MGIIFILGAVASAFVALLLSVGASISDWTWQPWITGALLSYFLSLLVPWVEARRA